MVCRVAGSNLTVMSVVDRQPVTLSVLRPTKVMEVPGGRFRSPRKGIGPETTMLDIPGGVTAAGLAGSTVQVGGG